MARLLALLAALAALSAAQPPREKDLKEEDDTLSRERSYAFNPLQAEKEIATGDFYWKKGSYKAAAMRYDEATRWNPSSVIAWRKLGDAREKLNDLKLAREAWKKILEVDPKGKDAAYARKRLRIKGA